MRILSGIGMPIGEHAGWSEACASIVSRARCIPKRLAGWLPVREPISRTREAATHPNGAETTCLKSA